jgi:hypothetical protein
VEDQLLLPTGVDEARSTPIVDPLLQLNDAVKSVEKVPLKGGSLELLKKKMKRK